MPASAAANSPSGSFDGARDGNCAGAGGLAATAGAGGSAGLSVLRAGGLVAAVRESSPGFTSAGAGTAGVRGVARVTSAGAGIGAGSGAGATVPVATPLLGVLGLAPLRLRSGAFGSQSRFFCASAASWPLVREVFLLTKGTGTLAT